MSSIALQAFPLYPWPSSQLGHVLQAYRTRNLPKKNTMTIFPKIIGSLIDQTSYGLPVSGFWWKVWYNDLNGQWRRTTSATAWLPDSHFLDAFFLFFLFYVYMLPVGLWQTLRYSHSCENKDKLRLLQAQELVWEVRSDDANMKQRVVNERIYGSSTATPARGGENNVQFVYKSSMQWLSPPGWMMKWRLAHLPPSK